MVPALSVSPAWPDGGTKYRRVPPPDIEVRLNAA
jgi:hypothetical protein